MFNGNETPVRFLVAQEKMKMKHFLWLLFPEVEQKRPE